MSAVDRPRPPRAFWSLGVAGVVCAALTIASGLFVRDLSTALPAVAVLCACGLMWQWQGGYRFLMRGRGPWSSVLPSLAVVPLALALIQVAMMVWWFTVTDLGSVPDGLVVLAGILLCLPIMAAALTVASNLTFAVRLRDAGLLNLTTPAGSTVSNEL